MRKNTPENYGSFLKKNNYIVINANTVFIKSNLSVYAQRILKVITTLIIAKDKGSNSYGFAIADFCKMYNLKGCKIHKNVRNGLNELMNKIDIPIRDDKQKMSYIIKGDICNNNIVVQIEPLFEKLIKSKPEIKYRIAEITNFKSCYSFRFYDLFLLKLGKKRKYEFEMDFKSLKDWLDIEDKYQNIGDVKKRVINTAIKEINGKNSEIVLKGNRRIMVEYEEIKYGGKTVSFKFKIVKRENVIYTKNDCR